MKKRTVYLLWLAVLLLVHLAPGVNGAHLQSLSKPMAGDMQLIFHGEGGPFRVEMRGALDLPWTQVFGATITEVQTGVYIALLPMGEEQIAFYRVVSETEPLKELKGWTIVASASAPANGQYYVAGEAPVVTARILDTLGGAITKASFSTLNLYMYGPQNPRDTVTAVKLLNAVTNRAARPHHYIDLKSNPEVQVSNNVLSYQLRPVTDESPGTYTIVVYATLAADPMQQVMKFKDMQIGTPNIEALAVTATSCASCHSGSISKKMYLYHADPGRSPVGSWALDLEPVRSCKACHNNDGYAAVRDDSGEYIVDHILRRVHGVHMGEGLKRPFNTNEVNGDFHYWAHLKFPADIKNCTACHKDDRWKMAPSKLACGSCHDNVWFGLIEDKPADMVMHGGGTRMFDSSCSRCHPPEIEGYYEDYYPIANVHKIPPVPFQLTVEATMTPPTNAKFYVAGEKPQVIVKVRNAATGDLVNPADIKEPLVSTNVQASEWRKGNLYVSGPRANTMPVLTTAGELRDPARTYANNDVRVRTVASREDPRVTRTADSIIYQLSDVGTVAPGTYTVFADFQGSSGLGGSTHINFQVGTATIEKQVASNCIDCHADTRMHGSSMSITFTPDICKSCHDNLHLNNTRIGWNSSNYGFGAAPLSRRAHGVHYGNYLDKPTEVHRTYDFGHVVFPQDVRNCTKCHAESTSWSEKPSRLACLACHDTDEALVHGMLNTFDPTLDNQWNGDEVETCIICHGKGSAFSVEDVHSIADPYVPPYSRARRE